MAQGMLPRIVYQMCVHGALIVGSQAKKLVGDELQSEPSDWDLVVPYEKWNTIALLIPEDARLNKFGGWRFETNVNGEMIEVDVWQDNPMNYLANCKPTNGGRVIALDFINNRIFSSEHVNV